eukprot:TRINITY_DN86863_c0_g1_i1.p1 TRINITY_DN86863_c0_g1~~TRINITY_DN86863_c0_g1_i1.p1  ORF type:complete len:173 (-),score=33.41 TRINITY_DN86863_c0_g1_i1:176-694(-)
MSGHQDWSDHNRRQGIGFNYDSDSRSRPRARSRSRDRRVVDQRQEKREKRKALWSRETQPEDTAGTKETRGSSSSPAGDRVPASGSKASSNGWERSEFSSSTDKDKFLRLMGAGKDKKSDAVDDSAAPKSQLEQRREKLDQLKIRYQQQELERQYWQGMQKNLHGRSRGLGA